MQIGQDKLQELDEQMRVVSAGLNNAGSHVYVRKLFSLVPLVAPPVTGASVPQFGTLAQPALTQIGQLLTQRPAEHVISPVFGTKLGSQSYVRILPSVVPVPDVSVAFVQAFTGAAPQSLIMQIGQLPTQLLPTQVIVSGSGVKLALHSQFRKAGGIVAELVPLPPPLTKKAFDTVQSLAGPQSLGMQIGQPPTQFSLIQV